MQNPTYHGGDMDKAVLILHCAMLGVRNVQEREERPMAEEERDRRRTVLRPAEAVDRQYHSAGCWCC